MAFIPSGEIIGKAHQVRTVSIKQSPQLPDGAYSFIALLTHIVLILSAIAAKP